MEKFSLPLCPDGPLRDAVIYSALKSLHNKIEEHYDAIPQIIKTGESTGFNVHALEAGRIEVHGDTLEYTFYFPVEQRLLPVFSERFCHQ